MAEPTLSKRGQEQFSFMGPFMLRYLEMLRDGYDSEKNPNGLINLGSAENSLQHGKLIEFYENSFKINPKQLHSNDALVGPLHLYRALAGLFNSYFNPITPVTEDHILTGAGASPILSNFFGAVADKGEGVLLAAPYYAGFDFDLIAINGVLPVGFPVTPEQFFTMEEVAAMECHYEQTTKAGMKIKAVILCNPHNPMGQCYPLEVIVAYAKFCEKHNLHLLSDEIYALSVFPTKEKPNPEPFISLLSIDWSKHGVNTARIHVVYGMSKDFNSNSFRIGVLVSQNNTTLLMTVLGPLGFSMVSSPAGVLWSNLLQNKKFLEDFIPTNQNELRIAYEYALKWVKFHKVPYLPSNAGHFLLVDFRFVINDIEKYGEIIPMKPEMNLFQREEVLMGVFIENRVFIGSGAAFHTSQGGWLRLTFSIERETIKIAFRRIEDMLRWPHWLEPYDDA